MDARSQELERARARLQRTRRERRHAVEVAALITGSSSTEVEAMLEVDGMRSSSEDP